MLYNDLHLSDKQLLLAVDSELPRRRAARIRAHLATCLKCRTRMAELEGTIADFAGLLQDDSDSVFARDADSRAIFKARLDDLATKSRPSQWPQSLRAAFAGNVAVAFVSAALLVATVVIWKMNRIRPQPEFESAFAEFGGPPAPNRSLTPGATRAVSVSDVCREKPDQASHVIPVSLEQMVFKEYGMANADPGDYEMDYLITPELGGSEDDPRNLWPEPHSGTAWNSYVKDALEDRLHELVCNGSIDLATAQHDIATDWISAYKKYFHTDRPSPVRTDLLPSSRQGPDS